MSTAVWVTLAVLGSFEAARTADPPEIDGALDDRAWEAATPYRSFVQQFPDEGAAPSEPTEVRVLHDDKFLYVGIKCFDSKPEEIVRTLARRDNPPPSDLVSVIIDSSGDRRTGYSFTVTAGNVLRDGLWTNNNTFGTEWDGVWAGEAKVNDDGWSAELAIPLRLLRFSQVASQEWGFHVRRELARTHEVLDSTRIPRGSTQFVSRFARLQGLQQIEPRRSLELLPYAAGRASLLHTEGARAFFPSAYLGLDLRLAITSDLALTATVNPDFGQVEADKLVLNLGNSETFFPEKRPFFTQGLDLFVPMGAEGGRAPHMLFYSRRVGLDTPILSAAKLVGTAAEGLEVGVLDAVVAGEANSTPDADPPNRRFRFLPLRPLHFGLEDELPDEQPVARNYFALVTRKRVLGHSKVGAWLIDGTPLSRRCEAVGAECEAAGQRAIAADWDLRNENGEWGTFGQLAGSQQTGNAAPRILRDGTEIAPGDLGWGTYLRAGRIGGEGIRAYAQYEHASPKFELNQSGYIGSQNVQSLWGEVLIIHPRKWGWLHELAGGVWAGRDWTTDGRMLNRGNVAGIWADGLWPNFTTSSVNCQWEYGGFDVREITGTGIGYQKAPSVMCGGGFTTDQTQPVSFHLDAFLYQNLPEGVLTAYRGYGGTAWITARPTPRVESNLTLTAERPALTADYVDDLGGDRYLFGGLLAPQLTVTFRQQLVLAPELTLQAYAQLFTASGRYGPFYEGQYDGSTLRMDELILTSADPAEYDFRTTALNINLVLRWEYRLGSTLYAVYTRSQQTQSQTGSGVTDAPVSYEGLLEGPANDTFLLKWSWYFDAAI